MKLKTLKDLKRDVPLITPSSSSILQGVLLETEIKQEVIKWLDTPRTLRMNANDFILVFFNITEEDLK